MLSEAPEGSCLSVTKTGLLATDATKSRRLSIIRERGFKMNASPTLKADGPSLCSGIPVSSWTHHCVTCTCVYTSTHSAGLSGLAIISFIWTSVVVFL